MAIIDTQKELIHEELILERLKKGETPNVALVDELIEETFKNRPAGLPRFIYREMKKGEASSSKDYNDMFKEIGQDLNVSFEEVKRLNNRLMSLFNYYESNRIKINKMLEILRLKVDSLLMKENESSNITIVGDSFDNFLSIDFKGDESRNIPKTDAFVNLAQSEVEIKRVKGGTIKRDLSNAILKFETNPEYEIINLSPFKSAIQDTIHNGWQSIVVTKEAVPVTAEFIIELEEATSISNISLDMQIGNQAVVTLFISPDGKEYIQLEKVKIISSYQWVFESRNIQAFKFQIEKKEHDRQNGSEFEYIFGSKHIEASDVLYNNESHLVSKPFELPEHKAIKRIRIEDDSMIPPNTNIRFYVGFDYGTNMIEWQEISKDFPVVTDMVKSISMEINQYTDGYGDVMFERFGSKFYRIAKLPYLPLRNSIQLMMGQNMWLRETIPAPFKYKEVNDISDEIVYQTGIHDWIRVGSTKKNYIRIQNGFDYLIANQFHRYTTYILCETNQILNATIKGTKDTSHAVYLNNAQIQSVNDKYELHLKKGWNKIEVYAYARKLNEELIIDLYDPTLNNQIFANKNPLKEISLYDLLNNTSRRDHDKFAVDDDGNIIVNYDPKRLDLRGEIIQSAKSVSFEHSTRIASGIEYSLNYEYSVVKEQHHPIRLMAILSKEDVTNKTTPRLKGYKLIVE